MKTSWKQWTRKCKRLTLPRLAVAAIALLAVALGLSACENVTGFAQPSLVRFIDASYIAPAVDAYVEGVLLAANYGEGSISHYGTIPPENNAVIKITAATGGATLVSSNGTLVGGHQHSIFLTDNGAAPTSYTVTVLEDQQVAAAGGHSAFRFINEAPKVGPVDLYVVPASTTLANSLLQDTLAVGGTFGYFSFASQTVTIVITPTGVTTPQFVSASLSLTGGEVYTVVIIDSQLTSNPPVNVVMVKDYPAA
jgi:hypothetical protein